MMKAFDLKGMLPVRFATVRAATEALAAPLSDEDCCVQSMPDASPVKWHLAHATWFFETFVLEAFEPGFVPHDPAFRMLFNSYYEAVGARHPRPRRGLLTRPSMASVRAYRAAVDARMGALLDRALPARAIELIELGLHHEQQHQELILTDVKHLLAANPVAPVYRVRPDASPATDRGADADAMAAVASATATATATATGEPDSTAVRWVDFDAGIVQVGAQADRPTFRFDNESPRHRRFVEAFALADRLVTNAEYRAFIDDGGYHRPELWLSEGWDFVQREGLVRPVYWRDVEGVAHEFTLAGCVPLDPRVPVSHLSYFEADAYARWAGARLPTEFEWEHAAGALAIEGNFVDSGLLHPRAAATDAGASTVGSHAPRQMYGDLWEWTSSSYAPYPGFAAAPGAVGEYNGKFMVNQYVLRGGSCATPRDHMRLTYRNFFPTYARWQFTGVRLARAR